MSQNNKPNFRPKSGDTGKNKPKQQRQGNSQQQKGGGNPLKAAAKRMETDRGQVIRATRNTHDTAEKIIDIHNVSEIQEKERANIVPISDKETLRFVGLGGQDGIGEKNMQVIEYGDSALIIDCGMDLGIELPGINFGIPDVSYLETIKDKIKGYIITHGHLDHIGGLPFVYEKYPAPIYGSHFTLGMVSKVLGDRERGLSDDVLEPELIELNMDNHERLKVGPFFIELVRVTHSIPDSSAVIVETPQGRIINTGDFRLDPEPLDDQPTDLERFKEFGKDGKTLLLLSDSTNAERQGRTPTEHTLQPSFNDIIKNAQGRVFVASFSSNINRIQMIINSAVEAGRKVAIDGRSMLATVELAVRRGTIKIPKGTVTSLRTMPKTPDEQVLVICTGGQGELNASLQRMSIGEHRYVNLKEGDTVVISSTPIPGNNIRYDQISDDLIRKGVVLFRAPTHEVDGVGPLHVSGHGFREEQVEMLEMTKPHYFAPIFAGPLNRKYHIDNVVENSGYPRNRTFMLEGGQTLEFRNGKAKLGAKLPIGTQLVDQSGSIVPSIVVKDRLVLAEDGLVTIILTVDRKTGKLLTSPDIITRGFIYMRENEELMNGIRSELRRATTQRFKRVDLDRFKQELKDHIQHYLYEHTRRSPVVIPVVNSIGANGQSTKQSKPVSDTSHS